MSIVTGDSLHQGQITTDSVCQLELVLSITVFLRIVMKSCFLLHQDNMHGRIFLP